MSAIYYNKEADTAFRIRSSFGNSHWCVQVSTNEGRAKMNAKTFAITSETIRLMKGEGKLFELQNSKTISRHISLIRAGLPIPEPEKKAKVGKTKRSDFKMKIGSLIDTNPDDYIGIFNADGYLIGHEYNGKEFTHELLAEELIEEVKNENQLNLF